MSGCIPIYSPTRGQAPNSHPTRGQAPFRFRQLRDRHRLTFRGQAPFHSLQLGDRHRILSHIGDRHRFIFPGHNVCPQRFSPKAKSRWGQAPFLFSPVKMSVPSNSQLGDRQCLVPQRFLPVQKTSPIRGATKLLGTEQQQYLSCFQFSPIDSDFVDVARRIAPKQLFK